MLKLTIYTDIKEFYNDTYEILLADEVKNLIMLGNLLLGMDGTDRTGWRNVDNWFMAAVKDERNVVLTVLMTPPMNLTIYETGNKPNPEAMEELIKGINKVSIPGVMAEKELGFRFADAYGRINKQAYHVDENQGLYKLEKVNAEFLSGGYSFRPANYRDMSFLPYWLSGFYSECHISNDDLISSAGSAQHHLDTKRLYILEDNGVAVAMAGNSRNMLNAGGVGPVYTPPYFRKKGYASACVAKLSQQILDAGKKYCVLYTNLANPISNSIYQKIGYTMVCESIVIKFNLE